MSEDRSRVVSGKKGRGSGIKSNGTLPDNCARRALSAIMANQSTIFTINARPSPSDRPHSANQPASQPCDARQNIDRGPKLSLLPKNIEPLSNLSSERRKNKWTPCRANNVRAQVPLLPALLSFAVAHRSWSFRFRCL